MRILMTLAAAAIAGTAMISSASASTVGCDQGEATSTLNAKSCRVWNEAAQASRGEQSYAMAPGANRAAPQRRVYDTAPLDTSRHRTGISGGASG
jgi:hypothetical protein